MHMQWVQYTSQEVHITYTQYVYWSLTFIKNVWFHAQGSDVQEGLVYPSLHAVPTLNKTAATCLHTSPRLKFQINVGHVSHDHWKKK